MSFITEQSGICLSPSGETVYTACTWLVDEHGKRYLNTEESKRILPEGQCLPVANFDCDSSRKTVDSGKFVSIVNTCSLPITITGFRNSDPERFSILRYPEYAGFSEYTTGNTEELPFTVEPFQRKVVNAFFHPLISELTSGTPGTLENRNGDKFRAKIDILPGFEVLNCQKENFVSVLWWDGSCGGGGDNLILMDQPIESSGQWFEPSGLDSYIVRTGIYYPEQEAAQYFDHTGQDVTLTEDYELPSNYCSASFKLEAEFLCEAVDREFLNNDDNFIEPDLSIIKKIQNQYSLSKKKTIELNIANDTSVQNIFTGLRDCSVAYASMLNNMNPIWHEAYGDVGISGSLGAFHSLVDGLIKAGQDGDINNLIMSTLPPTNISYGDAEIQVSYTSNNTGQVELDGYLWTGMVIENKPVKNAGDLTNQAVFFNAQVIQGPQEDVRMFIVDSGDFNLYPMKEKI